MCWWNQRPLSDVDNIVEEYWEFHFGQLTPFPWRRAGGEEFFFSMGGATKSPLSVLAVNLKMNIDHRRILPSVLAVNLKMS